MDNPKEKTTNNDEQIAQIVASTSTVPKLFWFDFGIDNDRSNASLWYVDPAASTPTKVLFDKGIFVFEGDDDRENQCFITGNVNLTTYQMTNLKTRYIFYFKGGKIWLVDTITLTKRQLSTETGITKNTLIWLRHFTNWQDPNNNTIGYQLKGPDGIPNTSDDIRRAVKVGMTSMDPPINRFSRNTLEILLDGRYIVIRFDVFPRIVEIGQPDFTNFTPIVNTYSDVETAGYDARRVILVVDGAIMRYDYVAGTLVTLYTPTPNEQVKDSKLDRDGYVYFVTEVNVPPYTYSIKRAPVDGGVTKTLDTFQTTAQLDDLWMELSPTHVVCTYPNASLTAGIGRSVPKSGGTSIILSNSNVNGGVVGQYHFSEDTQGQVHRVKLDGTGRITRTKAQLHGVSFGNSADWHYDFEPSTVRVLISGIDNKLKSYAINDDFTDPAVGTLMGTIPVNLNNFGGFDVGMDMLGIAGKRDTDFSFGTDILFLNATTPSSLKRLTNSNGDKVPLSDAN